MLTDSQRKVYSFIRSYILEHGIAPTENEISTETRMARKTVRHYIQRLEQDKFIVTVPGRKRNLSLATATNGCVQLPIGGKIAAGKPIVSLKTDQVLDLTDLLLGSNRYVLQVVGDSMSGDNICDGDYIICERRDLAKDGDIVVAMVNGSEATLKRFHKNEDGTVTLIPSNPNISPMVYPGSAIKIQAVYLGLIRLLD